LPPAEKRRIVQLTLVEGASVVAIAHEHGVHPNSLGQWKALYRAGKLDAPAKPRARWRLGRERDLCAGERGGSRRACQRRVKTDPVSPG
jgi:transposase-like protein